MSTGFVPPYTFPPTMLPPIHPNPPVAEEDEEKGDKHYGRILNRVLCLLAGLGGLSFIVAFDVVHRQDLNHLRLTLQTTSPSLVVYMLCLVLYGLYRPADSNYVTRIATLDHSFPIACLMLDLAWIWTYMMNDIRFVVGMTGMLCIPWASSIVAKLLTAEVPGRWCPTKIMNIKIAEQHMALSLPVATFDKMEEAFRVQAEADERAGMLRRANFCAVQQPAPVSRKAPSRKERSRKDGEWRSAYNRYA